MSALQLQGTDLPTFIYGMIWHMRAQAADPGSLKGSAEPQVGLGLDISSLIPSRSRLGGLCRGLWET